MLRNKRTTALLILLLSLVLLGQSSAQQLRKEGKYWVGEITKTFKVAKGGTLIMDEVRGDVTIRSWNKNEVNIQERKRMDIFTKDEAEAAMEESETGYRQQGNTITVGGPAFDRRWIQSKFEISVPMEFNCDIESQGGDLSITEIQGSVEASTGGGDIDLTDIDGLVDVRTGGGDIEISNTTKKVTAKTGGGDVDISDSQGTIKLSTGGGDITVERSKAHVNVSTGGGDVEVRETEDGVKVRTGGGEIQIIDANGDVNVSTGGGEIEIRNVTGDFHASTGGGTIVTRTVKGALSLTTGGGDVELNDIQGSVEVSTGGGDVSLEMTLQDFSVDHHIEVKTGGGEIDLTIPEKLPASIRAEIKFRKRSWEDYKIASDFPLKTTTDDEDSRYRIIRATGDINGGGDLINLRSGGGNIHIRKSNK